MRKIFDKIRKKWKMSTKLEIIEKFRKIPKNSKNIEKFPK